jgi:uncharacterized protein
VFKSLIKMFTGGGTESTSKKSGIGELEHFVDYVVRALVDNPQEVSISSEAGDRADVIKISCRKEDISRIIGKKGRTIMAIRSLVSGAAGRMKKKVSVEVVD